VVDGAGHPSLENIMAYAAASYWWMKVNLLGGIFVIGPLLLLGWAGMFLGRRWGRTLLHVYLGLWLSDKLWGAYVLPAPQGYIRLATCLLMACVLFALLRKRSWRQWTDRSA
jgi:hypothetical protein